MARPQREGLLYFPFDVDFFSDKKIKILKARYGVKGVSLYIYLLCEVYKNGYYVKLDEDYEYLISGELNMSAEEIKQVMRFLLERSLFDYKLFQSDNVITSLGIQRRFQEAVKNLAKRSPRIINKFWLLSEEETQSFIKVTHFQNYAEHNDSYDIHNANKSEHNGTKEKKEKENKEKENKEKERKGKENNNAAFAAEDRVVRFYTQNIQAMPSALQIEKIRSWTDVMSVDLVIKAMEIAAEANVRRYDYIKGILNRFQEAGFKTIEDYDNSENIRKSRQKQAAERKTGNVFFDMLGGGRNGDT